MSLRGDSSEPNKPPLDPPLTCNVCSGKMSCEGSDCEPPDKQRPTPLPRSGTGSCPHPGYVRRLPRVQYVRDGVVVSNVSLESFRATGGYALHGLRRRDVNNNYRRVALQFNFWRAVTVAAIRLVHTRVGFIKARRDRSTVGHRYITRVVTGVAFDTRHDGPWHRLVWCDCDLKGYFNHENYAI